MASGEPGGRCSVLSAPFGFLMFSLAASAHLSTGRCRSNPTRSRPVLPLGHTNLIDDGFLILACRCLLRQNQPQVRVLVVLGGGAQLLVLHPPRQPDDRQGEGLLLPAHRQLLQEHPDVGQLHAEHQVLRGASANALVFVLPLCYLLLCASSGP